MMNWEESLMSRRKKIGRFGSRRGKKRASSAKSDGFGGGKKAENALYHPLHLQGLSLKPQMSKARPKHTRRNPHHNVVAPISTAVVGRVQ